ncbi:hypothetical protein, partial [Prevotella jejuni]|uniref:hypothetical protein n=1 Tax=Prevotella jejuni TaxID=1177574 RepID=UPI0028ED8443
PIIVYLFFIIIRIQLLTLIAIALPDVIVCHYHFQRRSPIIRQMICQQKRTDIMADDVTV